MTAKETLLERVAELSEDEAAWLLAQLDDAPEYVPLTDWQIAAVERGIADAKAGRLIPHAEVMRYFELPNED